MKFLCVPCDQPMRLAVVNPPDRGSLTVRYACPECGYEMAMLTNPFETDMVRSLGVRIGPEAGATSAAAEAAGSAPASDIAQGATDRSDPAAVGAASGAPAEGASRCPFASMIPGLTAAAAEEGAGTPATGATSMAGGDDAPRGAAAADPVWTDAATDRLKVIPFFVRPMAKTGIERFAKERGYATIDERVLDEAKSFFGM